MFKNLPSLLHFQPKFFVGGPARFYLALFYDLVALSRPKSIVPLGFGDGEAFFTLCQAVHENRLDCRCVAIFRGDESDWNHDPGGREKNIVTNSTAISRGCGGKIQERSSQKRASICCSSMIWMRALR